MSDTPRTDEFIGEHSEWSPAPRKNWPAFARQLERELNAANDRIKMLEEDLMDAKNQYAVLVADVVLYEDRGERIKRLEEAGDVIKASLQRSLNSNEQGECKWLAELPMTDAEFAVFTTAFKAKESKP